MKNDIIRDAFVKKQSELMTKRYEINDAYIKTLVDFMKEFALSTKELGKTEIHCVCHQHLGEQCKIITYMSNDNFEIKFIPTEDSSTMFNSGWFDETYVKEVLSDYGVNLITNWDDDDHTAGIFKLLYQHLTKDNEKKR